MQWQNYVYHYGVGSLFFLAAMVTMIRGGALRWERPSDRFLMKGLAGGLLSFATIHGLWIWMASPR